MISILWGAIGSASGLLILVVSSIASLYNSLPTFGTSVLWLVIGPVTVVGAMVHQRRVATSYRYLDAVKTGIITSLIVSGGLLAAWLLYILLIEPDFFSIMISKVEQASKLAGDPPSVTKIRTQAASLINASPVFYVISFLVPCVSGIIASLVAAIGIKKKS